MKLSDQELLRLVLGEEAHGGISEALLSAFGGDLSALGHADLSRLRTSAGLGLKRAERLQAAVELGRRVLMSQAAKITVITSTQDIVRYFRPLLEGLAHEECWCLFLTSSNKILEPMQLSQGGVQGTVVDVRILIKRALELLAVRVVLVHNHPSGTAQPSGEDKALTEKIAAAAALFDIRLLDHVILAGEGEFSFRQAGFLRS